MIVQFLGWYLVVALLGLAALPLTLRLFGALPERGYAFARPLGILLTGYLFWLAYALGLLRNETGGAWLALLLFAALSLWLGRGHLARLREVNRYAILATELIFLAGFVLWATVRAYDPAADHTEEPMDLMFMSSIWSSPTYPPHDGWLSGYPIGYYYFGYWLLVMVGRLAGTPPEVAYTLGQACWFGLLLTGSFGIVYTLLRLHRTEGESFVGRGTAVLGGLLGAVAVGLAGNVQAILEWLYAQGVNVNAPARFGGVRNFPDGARVTNDWFIARGEWWWWRTSRVLADTSLRGEHREVIAEFPAFSYVLGDNHPHVLAMPIVIVVIALALVWYLRREENPAGEGQPSLLPRDFVLLGVTTVTLGSLVALNTWDFPAYWVLVTLAVFAAARERRFARAGVVAAILLGGALLLYAPYLLTAQSQASGIGANLFSPTRLGQFLWMFLPGLLAICALILLAWREMRPRGASVGALAALYLGIPVAFLSLAIWAGSTFAPEELAQSHPLPDAQSGTHLTQFLGRWLGEPWTLLLVVVLLALVSALWLRRVAERTTERTTSPLSFALLLAGIGLLLVWAPEFVFLDDNFGTRMNTVFKFYYQGWLLFGLAGSFAVTLAFSSWRKHRGAAFFAAPALALILAGLVFPLSATYSKTNGFSGEPTFDASAWVRAYAPAELAAARWLRDNAPASAVIAEAVGASYRSDTSRYSTLSGRATLLGWEGHERQWRGAAYNAMAEGRTGALESLYHPSSGDALLQTLAQWDVDYMVLGPAERTAYGVSDREEAWLRATLDLVFEEGDVRIYARRSS